MNELEQLKFENAKLKKELKVANMYYDLAIETIYKFSDIEDALIKLRNCELPARKFIRDYL